LADVCTFTAKIHDSVYDENAVFIFGKQASSSSISPQEQVNVGMLGNKTFDSLQKKMNEMMFSNIETFHNLVNIYVA